MHDSDCATSHLTESQELQSLKKMNAGLKNELEEYLTVKK